MIGQNRSSNQEVQFQNFGTRRTRQRMHVKVLIFKKIQGAQILIFFAENWHEASFYIKEQTQKYKFEIWLFKSTILDPRKSAFLVFEECFGFDSALKTIDAQMFFW